MDDLGGKPTIFGNILVVVQLHPKPFDPKLFFEKKGFEEEAKELLMDGHEFANHCHFGKKTARGQYGTLGNEQ